METNINESLGIDKPVVSAQEETNESSAEQVLSAIAFIVLLVGIVGTLIMAFTITTIERKYDFQDLTFNPMGVVLTIATLISSVTVWGLLKVICNISNSLKEINLKMQKPTK